ncbi:MAG: ATP-binding protein [Phaeodactylibacter sp.]|nr:ATP-binding protein [Phaeodactylibacter sp.]MCB9051538.1 ATP-binding protein [Lewinellaceae bacterium]
MLYNFRINIIVRIAIILALVAGAAISFIQGYSLTSVFLGGLLAFGVSNLIRYVNQTNRDLASFIEGVQYNDFITTTSARHKGESFGELYQSFNMVNRKFQEIRAEKEANHQFLQSIVEHIDIGLLCFNGQEEVILMNKALQGLIHKSYLINLGGLQQVDEGLWSTVKQLKPGERELVKLTVDNKLKQLSIQCIELVLKGEHYRLVSFQNIQTELEQQELVAWQKLIRILTHEIMNSVAPIASLSSTISDVIAHRTVMDEGSMKHIKNSVDVIKKRSEGLLGFTETYRTLTRIPPPNFELVEARHLVEELCTLFQPELERKGIKLESSLPVQAVSFQADPALLEQVLINLVKNAADAVTGRVNPRIKINVQKVGAKAQIIIADNGPGIPEEVMEQAFVPFFTTKKEGSGIGLSLSRQIMRMHKGSIELHSVVGEGTVATLSI